ncbi:MAG: cation diffusion facilitator family transporter [Candidatus Eisenbacteria bacterium]|nr:cation diffusion facilitator family transporter [Candidatus Latescibacterota bacterium]MBD3303439.1 cation diffusion facilitator family transporter [Candidatus Eisenbacteria bacterium]
MHDTGPQDHSVARLRAVLLLTLGFLIVEVIGGFLSNSLALLSDAGHMFSDVTAQVLALVAMTHRLRPPDPKRTYGYRRIEVVSALANGILLGGVAVLIAIEGAKRWSEPPEIRGGIMLGVACVGLCVNLIGIALLHAGSRHSLGVRGAFFHLIGDAIGSVGAIGAAIVIALTGWTRVDALASFGIAVLILIGAGHLIRESVHILLEGVPRHIDVKEVEARLNEVAGVVGIHDLHVWRIGSDFDTLTVHLVVADRTDPWTVTGKARRMLRERFGIDHSTIEVDDPRGGGSPGCAGTICEREDG